MEQTQANDIHSDALREAEMQKKNAELQTLFRKNILFFQQADPSIYNKYVNFTPEKIRLIFTEDNYVDLANTDLDNKLVYGREPREFARENVEGYFKTPLFQRFNAIETEMIDLEKDIHTRNMNRLIAYTNAKDKDRKKTPMEDKTEFMIILGLGLGYHIEEILKRTTVRHLNIVEPHEDIFYAALHTVDWESITQHFEAENTSINLIIGQAPNRFSVMMAHHLHQIGVFNAAKPYIFSHLVSKEMQASSEDFFSKLPIITSSAGYYDDERIGLSHTINNFRKKLRFLKGHSFLSQKFLDQPVFLVANGPSLDIAKDFLKENQHKAIIVSCGTALSSLYKLGIKPDIHVELERTRPTMEWIETGIPADFRKGILLLAINTVHPELSNLFDHVGIGLKFNDLGAEFIHDYLGRKHAFVQLGASNPTVANAGLSFCTALGFSHVYLVGLDLGFSRDGKHHSSHSVHYDVNTDNDDTIFVYTPDKDGNFEFEGNFGGRIISTNEYAQAKVSFESLIADFKNFKCFNISHGIKIEGATAMPHEDIDTSNWPSFDKKAFCKNLYREYFTNEGFVKAPNTKEIAELFKPGITLLEKSYPIINREFSSRDQAIDAFIALHNLLLETQQQNKKYSYYLLKGSFAIFLLMLAKTFYIQNDEEESVAIFNHVNRYFCNFLRDAKEEMKTDFIRNDTRKLRLSEKIAAHKKQQAEEKQSA